MNRRSFLIFLVLLAVPKTLFGQGAEGTFLQRYFEIYKSRQALYKSVEPPIAAAMEAYNHQHYRLADLRLQRAELYRWQFLVRKQIDGAIYDVELNIREEHARFRSHPKALSFIDNLFVAEATSLDLLRNQNSELIVEAAKSLSHEDDFLWALHRDLVRAQAGRLRSRTVSIK